MEQMLLTKLHNRFLYPGLDEEVEHSCEGRKHDKDKQQGNGDVQRRLVRLESKCHLFLRVTTQGSFASISSILS